MEQFVYRRRNPDRSHYGEAAGLLPIVGEIKEQEGMVGAKRHLYEQYKKKFDNLAITS